MDLTALAMKKFCQTMVRKINEIQTEQWRLLQKRAITPREYAQLIAESEDLKRHYQLYPD